MTDFVLLLLRLAAARKSVDDVARRVVAEPLKNDDEARVRIQFTWNVYVWCNVTEMPARSADADDD